MAEASFEAGSVQCALLTWTRSDVQPAFNAAVQAHVEQHSPLVRHFEVTKPVISGAVRALQCAALVLLGVLLNRLFELLSTARA